MSEGVRLWLIDLKQNKIWIGDFRSETLVKFCEKDKNNENSPTNWNNYIIYNIKSNIKTGVWSSGMILASGARGSEFDSRNAPFFVNLVFSVFENCPKPIFIQYFWIFFNKICSDRVLYSFLNQSIAKLHTSSLICILHLFIHSY